MPVFLYSTAALLLSLMMHVGAVIVATNDWQLPNQQSYEAPVMQVQIQPLPPEILKRRQLGSVQAKSALNKSPSRGKSRSDTIAANPDVSARSPQNEKIVDIANNSRRNAEKIQALLQQLSRDFSKLTQTVDAPRTRKDVKVDELVAGYVNLMRAEIIYHWRRPPNARSNMEVLLYLNIARDGKINRVRVAQSSGDTDFDDSALSALERVPYFSGVAEMSTEIYEKHFRKLNLRFRPDDLD